MPRGPRLDAPGCLQHVMVRGIERRLIFDDDHDRRDLLRRLDRVFPESGMSCYAWALMPNHVHLVVRTGPIPLARVMARVNTGYARAFNQRHERIGHLFQGRYKSILVENEAYLLALVRYVHLNPLRAGLVDSLAALGRYRWTGHATLLGNGASSFQNATAILDQFGGTAAEARRRLLDWMRIEFAPEVVAPERALAPEHDWRAAPGERVDRDSLDWSSSSEAHPRAASARRTVPESDLHGLIEQVCGERAVPVGDVLMASVRRRPVADARAELAYRASAELGLPRVAVARALGISKGAVTRACSRGRALLESSHRASAEEEVNFSTNVPVSGRI